MSNVNGTRAPACRALVANLRIPALATALIIIASGRLAVGQTPGGHEQHHPPAAAGGTQPATSGPALPSATGPVEAQPPPPGGVMGGMGGSPGLGAAGQAMGGEQMCCGGAPPPSPLYPSLMAVPELGPERRLDLQRQAADRMSGGAAMMADAFAALSAAAQSADRVAMEQANLRVHEGLTQFESGLALRRALEEGRAPRDVALAWFRSEMNLVALTNGPPPHGLFGLSWFHYVVMGLLVMFVVTSAAMSFGRMRRAEALVARLAGGQETGPLPQAAGLPVAPALAPGAATTAAAPLSPGGPAVRDIAPSRPNSWSGLLRVVRIFDETPSVKTFRLIDRDFGPLPFSYLPGQFLTVTAVVDGVPVKRSYTIASSPTDRDYCEITVKREEQGAVSRFLHDRVVEDDTLEITAPSGRFTFTGEESTSLVLIGGGVGVTPMMSVSRFLTKRSWLHDIHIVVAARTEPEIIFREELEYLERRYRNLHVTIVVETLEGRDGRYVAGRITRELLESRIPDLQTSRVHICGPPPMMEAVKTILAELGVPADQVRTEVFQGKEVPRAKLEALPAAATKVAVVTFARSRRTAMLPPNKTVLEASEDVGVNIEYSCRIGTCGVCRTKLLSGSVSMEVQEGLEPGDKEHNVILACQARTSEDVSVDA